MDIQIRQFGMSNVVGLVSFPEEDGTSRRPYSKTLHNLMDAEASRLVSEAYKRTETVLLTNRDKLKKVCLLPIADLNFKFSPEFKR